MIACLCFDFADCGRYLCLDNKCSVSSNGDLLLHDTEVVEPADKQPGTVQPQSEIDVMAGEAVLVILDILTPVNIEEEEVMKMTSREGFPQYITWFNTKGKKVTINII